MIHFDSVRTVYYLPGYGGRLHTGLGAGLLGRGLNVCGRATVGEFRAMPFADQVRAVADDLQTHFWHPDAHVVANSFGAYLFLNAQALLPSFPGKVLLISPILGAFTSVDEQMTFAPPRATHLRELAEAGQFRAPQRAEVHVGSEDWQSVPSNVQAYGALTGIVVTVAPGLGHMLGERYLGPVLDKWLLS